MKPTASVCVVTYNQAPYIARCLTSVVEQSHDLALEIIVGDDGSTDGTRDVVSDFARRHPALVRPLFQPHNVGAVANYRATHQAAAGQLIAHLDGDDAFLPGKLERQVEALARAPACPAVVHQLRMIEADGRPTGQRWPESAPARIDLRYLVLHHPIFGHSSLMYRRGGLDALLAGTGRFIDFRAYVELASRGPLIYLPVELGLYTVGVGISKANSWLPEVLAAVDAAGGYGLDDATLRAAKSHHLFTAALNAHYRDDGAAFVSLIEQSVALGDQGRAQRFFHALRHHRPILKLAGRTYRLLRDVGLARNLKMRFD